MKISIKVTKNQIRERGNSVVTYIRESIRALFSFPVSCGKDSDLFLSQVTLVLRNR